MFELSYSSAAGRLFDLQQLAQMLEGARRNNARLGVSGILLYEAGSFIQARFRNGMWRSYLKG